MSSPVFCAPLQKRREFPQPNTVRFCKIKKITGGQISTRFAKLADKSSKAAKLFNAVHKAQVSWRRIKPLMQPVQPLPELPPRKAVPIQAEDLSFAYPGEAPLFSGLSFTLRPGQIIGVTGPVACGKSTLGRVFLCESPYGGHLRFGDRELRDVTFGYDEQETVLRHLSFQVAEGEQVTLTGRTGAGKSTVFKLLLGLYAPQEGAVLLQGVPASEIPPAERRKLFGCVEQSFHRVPSTVRDQITLYDRTGADIGRLIPVGPAETA